MRFRKIYMNVLLCAALCLLIGLVSGCSANTPVPEATAPPLPGASPEPDAREMPSFEITLDNGVTLKGELYADSAPLACANFIRMANAGELNGLPLSAIGDGAYIQMDASSPENEAVITGEYLRNGYVNTTRHLRGTLTMDSGKESGTSVARYFVCLLDAPSLDGSFASFGSITEGLDALDAIAAEGGEEKTAPVVVSARADAKGFPDDPTNIHEEDMKKMQYPTFTIQMADGGIMQGELYPDIAPNSVANFVALANSGFYDGLIFHRVIPGFMIQGGDPQGTGTGGPGYHIAGEFRANGVQNNLVHTKGVLSWARAQSNNSAGSQFFVMVADAPHLDGSYAAFGRVTQGLDVADRIVSTQRGGNDRPVQDQRIAAIRVETYGVDYPLTKLP